MLPEQRGPWAGTPPSRPGCSKPCPTRQPQAETQFCAHLYQTQNSPFQDEQCQGSHVGQNSCWWHPQQGQPHSHHGPGAGQICAVLVPTLAWISLVAPSAHLPLIFVPSPSNNRSKPSVNNLSFSRKGYFYYRDSACCLPQPCIQFTPLPTTLICIYTPNTCEGPASHEDLWTFRLKTSLDPTVGAGGAQGSGCSSSLRDPAPSAHPRDW